VVSAVVVVLDEGLDLGLKVAGQEVVLEQDAVFKGLVPALDLALGLGVHRGAAHVAHLVGLDVFSQFARDVAGTIVAEQPGLVQHRGAVASGCDQRYIPRVGHIPGVGVLNATALIAAVGDASSFAKARDLGAWLGLVPRQHTTGGKPRLLGISKRGNTYLRTLLIHGARAALPSLARSETPLGRWLTGMIERGVHRNAIVVALANKLARIAWAALRKDATFERGYPAKRGTLLTISETEGVLYTRGTVDFYKTYPGQYVPSPLKITVYEQDSSLEALCDEILGLTKMNWNNTQMDGRLPITLECAKKIGDIMKYVSINEKPQVSYSFYM
jgi:Transposase IS116/IS110/IS902 family